MMWASHKQSSKASSYKIMAIVVDYSELITLPLLSIIPNTLISLGILIYTALVKIFLSQLHLKLSLPYITSKTSAKKTASISRPACNMSMAAGLIDSEKTYKSFHRRNNSGELDVFEASRYFSGYNEAIGYNSSASFTHKMIMREERHGHKGRMSLDVPVRNLLPQQFHGVVMEKQMKEKKNSKQPSSPGGRLASFLNSLFSQSASKKKKKSSKSSLQSMKDEDESPGGRRRRRSSISHFRSSSSSTTTNADSNKSIYSSLSSGFRTPPYIQTPTKGCREFKSSSEQKPAVSLSKCNGTSQAKSSAFQDDQLLWDEKKKRNLTWLEENQKFVNGVSEKHRNLGNEFSEKEKGWMGKYFPEEKEFRKFSTTEVDIDDRAESDSSSDLFELQNYDLGYCSSGLPVYETTDVDSIKRSAATISNGPL